MMFRGKHIFNASFDVYADNYDQVRPSYPDALFKSIKEICELSRKSVCLEIGAGSGIATRKLADFSGRIVALEPGENLIEIAKKQLRDCSNIDFVQETFEEYCAKDKFNAILAFTSFHWLTDNDMFRHIGKMLKQNGKLVIVWNSFFQSKSMISNEIDQIYHKWLAEEYPSDAESQKVNDGVLAKLGKRIGALANQTDFQIIYLDEFVSSYRYDANTYPKLLATFPKIIGIEDDERQKGFLHEISEVVSKHGEITVPVLSSLIILEKKLDFISEIVGLPKN